jgi:predicted nucleic acid-binding protein
VTVLLDSDVLIEILRGKNQEILARWEELGRGADQILYSPVTAAELWGGARPSEFERLEAFLKVLDCAIADAETGRKAGEYLRQFAKSHGVETADALIAATAWVNGASVWTRNRKHYPMNDIRLF